MISTFATAQLTVILIILFTSWFFIKKISEGNSINELTEWSKK
jgi:hypothetical protein